MPEGDELRIEIHGELGAILALCQQSKTPGGSRHGALDARRLQTTLQQGQLVGQHENLDIAILERARNVLHFGAAYRTRYFDFTAKHFHERLREENGFALGYTWTKLRLQEAGLVRRAPKRSAHRKKRPRRPLPGMLLFQDGSHHAWLAGQPPLDLVVTMDDATAEIYSAFLVAEEGTFSSLRGLAEVIGRHGLFCALYRPRPPSLLHPQGRRQGCEGAADPGRPGARAARGQPALGSA